MKKYMPTNPIYCEQLKHFKAYLETLGYRSGTVTMLQSCAGEFLWRMEAGNRPLTTIRSTDILEHHEYLQQRPHRRKPGGLSEMMIHHHMYALKVFFNWQLETGAIQVHPMGNLQFGRPKTHPREVLTTGEIKQLYEVCENLKERVLLGLFYGCGLRKSEGVKLAVNDVKFKESMLYVRSGKRGKARAVPMNGKVAADLKAYLERERFAAAGVSSFTTNARGRGISGESLNKLLKALLKKAGIDKTASLHSLRHSIATHLLENGLPVEYVRDFLGHKHLESTQVYTRINQKQFRKWS